MITMGQKKKKKKYLTGSVLSHFIFGTLQMWETKCEKQILEIKLYDCQRIDFYNHAEDTCLAITNKHEYRSSQTCY